MSIPLIILITLGILGLTFTGGIFLENKSEEGVSLFISITSFIGIIITISLLFYWVGSFNKAKTLNKIYHTKYVTSDLFWSRDIVKNYAIGEKKNYNVKMDINKEK